MIIVLLLFLFIDTIHGQLSTPNQIYNCSFSNHTYLTNSAVFEQIQFVNQTSIILTANYAFLSSSSLSSFELGLIYQFSSANFLVPFPVLFDCASIVRSCQLKTIAGTTITARHSEPIPVQLTSFNFNSRTTSGPLNSMGLYLKQGRYQLSNCSLDDGQQMTDPQTIFHIQIQYEKSVGSPCDPTEDPCGSSFLTNCSSSSTCTCLSSSNSLVSYSNSFYCADRMNTSKCQIFPSRCITWCNQTRNYLCTCPSDTLKIQRNSLFSCELPVNSNNCSINDDQIRRCPLGQCCFNRRCIDCSMTTTAITKTTNSNDGSLDGTLRLALGIIAGLLGTSVIILLSAFCWLRQRQKHRRIAAEKSLTDSSSSSSLYISPVQHQFKFSSSISTIFPYPAFYRAASFRQAVLFSPKPPRIIERVSTKRDSYTYEKDDWSLPIFNTLEYVMPPPMMNPVDKDKQSNIYQIIMPPTPILTHAV